MKSFFFAVMVFWMSFINVPMGWAGATEKDARIEVVFPPLVKSQTLKVMRSHLMGMAIIQQELAEKHFQAAATTATRYLSAGSPLLHKPMQDEMRYMPSGMKVLGGNMHRAVAHFIIAAQDSAVSGDYQPTLQAMAKITQACVACHATYKLR